MLKIVFKTCKNETLMTSYSHFTKFFSRKILKHFTQDRSTNLMNSAPDLDWLNLRDSLETQLCTFDCLYRKFRVMKLLLKIPSKIHKNYYYKWYPHMSWGRNRGSCTGRNPLRYSYSCTPVLNIIVVPLFFKKYWRDPAGFRFSPVLNI